MFKVVKKKKKHCHHTQHMTFLASLGNLTVVWISLLISLNVITKDIMITLENVIFSQRMLKYLGQVS